MSLIFFRLDIAHKDRTSWLGRVDSLGMSLALETDWLAGAAGLELRNVIANYALKYRTNFRRFSEIGASETFHARAADSGHTPDAAARM